MLNIINRFKKSSKTSVDDEKDKFISAAAHQLRSPLSTVKGSLSILMEGELGTLSPEQKNFLEKASEANDKMVVLVNDFLNIENLDKKKYKVESLREVKIVELINEITKDFSLKVNEKNLEIKIQDNLDQNLVLEVDYDKIYLALKNIIENSIVYSLDNGQITIEIENDSKDILIKVRDSGIGIPKEEQKNIFKRFYRGSNATLTKTESSGLGLYIAKTIVEYHNGQIWFESNEGEGTTFFITLPVLKK